MIFGLRKDSLGQPASPPCSPTCICNAYISLHLLATSPDFCLIQQQGTRNKIAKSEKRGNATIANSLTSSTFPFYRLWHLFIRHWISTTFLLGTLTVEEVYKDRDQFASLVREVASPDVGRMGIEILSFTIKDVYDNVTYLQSLGKSNCHKSKINKRKVQKILDFLL